MPERPRFLSLDPILTFHASIAGLRAPHTRSATRGVSQFNSSGAISSASYQNPRVQSSKQYTDSRGVALRSGLRSGLSNSLDAVGFPRASGDRRIRLVFAHALFVFHAAPSVCDRLHGVAPKHPGPARDDARLVDHCCVPLCSNQRCHLPTDIFQGRLSHEFLAKSRRTGVREWVRCSGRSLGKNRNGGIRTALPAGHDLLPSQTNRESPVMTG